MDKIKPDMDFKLEAVQISISFFSNPPGKKGNYTVFFIDWFPLLWGAKSIFMKFKLSQGRGSAVFFNLVFSIPIMLFCAHLFTSLRNPPVLFSEINQPFFCAFTVLLGLGIFIRKTTIYLDKYEPITVNLFKRLMKQLLLGFLIPLIFMIILLVIYDRYLDGDPIHFASLIKELIFLALFLYIFNGVYISIGLERQVSTFVNEQIVTAEASPKLLGYQKGAYVPINLGDVALISQIEHLNWIVTFSEERYVLNLSLKKAHDILNAAQFFRINRSQIVHKEVIQELRPGSFGKIELTLKVQEITTTVSKGRAKHFRKWFNAKNE